MQLKAWPLYTANNSTVQLLPESAIAVSQVVMACTVSTSPGTGVILSPVTGAPGATQVQFLGTVNSPSATVTLGVAPVTNQKLDAYYIPAVGNPLGY